MLNKVTKFNNIFSSLLAQIHNSSYLAIADDNGWFRKEYSYNQSTDQIRKLIQIMHSDFVATIGPANWGLMRTYIEDAFVKTFPSKILDTIYVIKPSVFEKLTIEKFSDYMFLARNHAGFCHIYYNDNISFIVFYNEL